MCEIAPSGVTQLDVAGLSACSSHPQPPGSVIALLGGILCPQIPPVPSPQPQVRPPVKATRANSPPTGSFRPWFFGPHGQPGAPFITMTYRLAFTGGRDYYNFPLVEKIMSGALAKHPDLYVHYGDALGLDRTVKWVSKGMGIPGEQFDAKWTELGKRAGPERNGRMIADVDALVVFSGGPGTADCKMQAVKRGIPAHLV